MSRFPATEFLLSVAAAPQLPLDEGAEVAFAGRSNAGKSSAINAIAERHSLARISKTPGRTRLLNYFAVQGADRRDRLGGASQRIVDLPGYGYASVSNKERDTWMPLLEVLRQRSSLRALFLVVDSRRGIQDEDRHLIEWADPDQRRVHILLAKSDKLTRNAARAALAAARTEGAAGVQLFSAHDGTGVAEAQRALLSALAGKD